MSSSSSTSGLSLITSGSSMRLNGTDLASGLDTESLIKALTYNTQSRIDNTTFLEDKAQWKQDSYRSIYTLISNFENKYFSYTSSDTNLLSPNFFNSTTLTSSSSLVSASGDKTAAAQMIINSITSLASAATYNSTQRASSEQITSSANITDSWATPSTSVVAGKSLVLHYNDKDYTLTLGSNVTIDPSASASDNTKTLVSALNSALSKESDLSGVKFEQTADGTGIAVSSDKTVSFSASSSYSCDEKFLSALNINGGAVDFTDGNGLYGKVLSANSYLNIKVGDEVHTVKLGKDITLSDNSSENVAQISDALNNQFKNDPDLKNFSATPVYGKLELDSGGTSFAISGGSQNLLDGLGFSASDNTQSTLIGTSNDNNALMTTYLGDALAGTKLTFTLDGISKTITFDVNDETKYSDLYSNDGNSDNDLVGYLQSKLNSAFGTNKVSVGSNGSNLTFGTSSTSSVLAVTASDTTGVLGTNGALHIETGDSNRINLQETLADLSKAGELTTSLNPSPDAGTQTYKFTVNGKEFSFDSSSTIADVMSKINGDTDVGVTISYSQTADTFNIIASETGSQGQIDIQDVSGNLSSALFGNVTGNVKAGKDLEMNVTLNGTTTDITRSANSFDLDGVDLVVSGTTADGVSNAGITFSSASSTDDVYKKISDFVDAYNNIITTINTMMKEKPSTDSQYKNALSSSDKADMTSDEIKDWETNAKKGIMQNDSTLGNILSDFRSSITSAVSSAGLSLSEIGISTKAYDYTSGGVLEISDASKLKNALNQEPDKVEALFTATDGVASRMKTTLDKYVSGSYINRGVLVSKAGSDTYTGDELSSTIKSYQTAISDLKEKLTSEQNRYIDRFSRMEAALSQLNSQYSSLSSYFSS